MPSSDDRTTRLLADVVSQPPDGADDYELARERGVDRFFDQIAATPEPRPLSQEGPVSRRWLLKRGGVVLAASVSIVALAAITIIQVADQRPERAESGVVYDYGEATAAMESYEIPAVVEAARTNDSYAGRTMASGFPFDPAEHLAASSVFPLGVILEVRTGTASPWIRVPVRDTASSPLVLSSGALSALGVPPEAGRVRIWVRAVDYEAKVPAARAL